jgi:hypothetical protein
MRNTDNDLINKANFTENPKINKLKSSNAVFFNLFMVAEPKMTKINFEGPKLPSKKLCGNPTFLK